MPLIQALPKTAAEAHCRRVAAWCCEIAVALDLPRAARARLTDAAMKHHDGPGAGQAFGALLRDCMADTDLPADPPARSPRIPEIGDPIGRILEMADRFDEELEFAPYADASLIETLETTDSPAVRYVLPFLRKSSRAGLLKQVQRLPVCPSCALEAIHLIGSGEYSLETVESIAAKDPVLTGSVIQAANTAMHGRSEPVRELHRAIVRIGAAAAATTILAAALRPLLAVRGTGMLWRHSVESAYVAQRIAAATSHIDTGQAYVLGLLHDVGRLLLTMAPAEATSAHKRLVGAGVPDQVSEILTFGTDHADAGAGVLETWGLPPDFVQAVAFHHQPERVSCELASLLYLVEFWTGSEEDLPSQTRMYYALDRTGLSLPQLDGMRAALCATAIPA
jgi:HD-like signal output (HDOD) protein